MKVMMDLYQEITAESSPLEKCSTVPNDSSGDTRDGPKPMELQENAKSAENIPLDGGGPTIISDHQAQCEFQGRVLGVNSGAAPSKMDISSF